MRGLTYKKAGVDIDKANIFVRRIRPLINSTKREGLISQIGSFAGLFKLDLKKYKAPIFVSSTDGVGTKLKIAIDLNKHDTVGIDLVAMNVNDILCFGAEPLYFLDYISCGRLNPDILVDVVRGITRGCREAGCALIGGETAQMPGMYMGSDYDLAGFCVGVVEKNEIVDGKNTEIGDRIIGISSNGLHSNGFSLVRKIFSKDELKRMAKELLKPTRIYVRAVLSLLKIKDLKQKIKGIAHISGGAFYEKIPRIIPEGLGVRIEKDSWQIPKIFKLIQDRGNVSEKEMYRTFNMGVGMVLVVNPESVRYIISKLKEFKLKSWVIGEVVKGKREVEIV
jgi:phosphoribosylformylglycinamidine cyclo-ligase